MSSPYGSQQSPFDPSQVGPTAPQPPKPPKQSHKGRNTLIVLGAATGVVIAIAIGSSANSGLDAADPTSPQTSSKPAPSKAVPVKKWVRITTLTGSADKSSDTIKLKGGKVMISYNFTGSTGVGGVYLLEEGVNPEKDGAFPDVTVSDAGKDSTIIRRDAGDYYLRIINAGFKYTVVVFEER